MSIKSFIKRSKALYDVANVARKLPWPLLSGMLRLLHAARGVTPDSLCFASFGGKLYNDNPRAVCEALHAVAPGAKVYFILDRRGMASPDVPDYVRRVPRFSLAALRAMATCRVLVLNEGMKPWMRKFPDQYYVQLWHGERGFKRIRLDKANPSPFYRKEAQWIDLMVSGSDFATRNWRSAFGFEGEILECGCPRNDLLLANPPGAAEKVRKALGIPEGVRVLLYAPTFRNATSGGKQNAGLSLARVRKTLEAATGERWLCVTRSHELNSGISSDAALDASGWVEPSELLLACDMLITDYSSIAGDFMLLGRPALFFQPDRADYDAERGLYFDPDKSPLLVAHTEEELLALLSRPIDGPGNCKAVLDFLGTHESGHASEAVAKRIAERL